MASDPNLTSALRNRNSLLRRYVDQLLPELRPLQADYRAQAGRLLVPGGTADPATVGAAFDFGVRFALDRHHVPQIAFQAFGGVAPALEAIAQVIDVAQHAEPGSGRAGAATWALALTTTVYRVGGVPPDSPLLPLLRNARFTAETLLALAPADALRQLRALADLAAERLLPALDPPYALGPIFDGSALLPADADVIADGLLLDLKTRLGRVDQRTGSRVDSLPGDDLRQLVAYALFDHSDAYRIDAIGIYSARYGSLIRWPLAEVLPTPGGRPLDLAGARDEVWRLLGG